MLEVAQATVDADHVVFMKKNLLDPWNFELTDVDLITCSLVLEHIENLDHIFHEVEKRLKHGGLFYVCELHPFKQYQGSQVRFDRNGSTQKLTCHTHHIADYFKAGKKHNLKCTHLDEWFDEGSPGGTPRLLSIVFEK